MKNLKSKEETTSLFWFPEIESNETFKANTKETGKKICEFLKG